MIVILMKPKTLNNRDQQSFKKDLPVQQKFNKL